MRKKVVTSQESKEGEYVTKSYLLGEFKEEFSREINEMMDIKLQGVVDILTKEIRAIREDLQQFWIESKTIDRTHDRRITELETRVDVLETTS
jgi:hypothetical protein